MNPELPDRSAQLVQPVRVALIEDMDDVREGLADLFDGSAGFRCQVTFRTMEEALAAFARERPDIVLTDIGLPGMSGIDGIRVLRERHPTLPVLALTIYGSDDHIFEALCAGASGYLLKNTPPARLVESLHSYKTAAAHLEISTSTISFHLQNIYAKLQVHSKSEAVATALRQRLV